VVPEPTGFRDVAVTLHGMHYSVYVRVARLALAEKRVDYTLAEVNPFAPEISPEHLKRHPFNRVPVLEHDGFSVYETAAIARYVDEAFDGPRLQPAEAKDRARMTQIIGIIDSYGYRPMVRQVFLERISKPARGGVTDEAAVAEGLEKSAHCLGVLEGLSRDGPFLLGD
jgi:glutathione S-transferase